MAADHLMLAAKAPALVGTPHAASAATSQAQALAVVGTPFISGAQLTGSYFVHSNGRVATIAQNGTDLILTDELGKSTRAQWVDADQFSAWGQVATIVQDGDFTHILWKGNSWDRAQIGGSYFVQSNDQTPANVTQNDLTLTLTDENGNTTQGQWLNTDQFSAWGQTATVVQNGVFTDILWNGNSWGRAQIGGSYFVKSNNQTPATVTQNDLTLTLTDEYGNTTQGQWLNADQFTAWGQTVTVCQNGFLTQILWAGNSWDRADLAGEYFVQSNNKVATISQNGDTTILNDENGNTTQAQWANADQFTAWGQTVTASQNGFLAQILWSGNSWNRGDLSGSYFVESNEKVATIRENGDTTILNDENGNTTQAQWLNADQFRAWGQIATVVQDGVFTDILWKGNSWEHAQIGGSYFVQSNNEVATICQHGDTTILDDENGNKTQAQWLNADQFTAWGQVVTVSQNGFLTQILWNGNSWNRADVAGKYFVQSNGKVATIAETGSLLTLIDENGNSTQATWLNPNQFSAFGQVATVAESGFLTQILWIGNSWNRADLAGEYVVRSNAMVATIGQNGDTTVLQDENGKTTQAQWLNADQFTAWGQVATVSQNGFLTQILWNGNSWSRADLPDPVLQSMVRADYVAHQSITRNDVLAIFNEVELDGVVSSAEFSSLKDLVAGAASLGIPAYVQNLADKVVNHNAANAQYESLDNLGNTLLMPLGDLSAGSSGNQLQMLVNKWFHGIDYPVNWFTRTNPDGTTELVGGAYSAASGTLYVGSGARDQDVFQGNLGDCTLMASLAEVAYRRPGVIASMFIDNGDGTWTVRFYHNGIPEYVTVDNELPGGGSIFDHPTSGALWAALAEKAIVEINEEGWLATLQPNSNSYAAIDNGNWGTTVAYLSAITGNLAGAFPVGMPVVIAAAWQTGDLIVLGSGDTSFGNYVEHNHAYAMVGYNATSSTPFLLFNPWGIGGGVDSTGQFFYGKVAVDGAALTTYFGSAAVTFAGVESGPALVPALVASRTAISSASAPVAQTSTLGAPVTTSPATTSEVTPRSPATLERDTLFAAWPDDDDGIAADLGFRFA